MNNQEIAQELRAIADQVESLKPTVIAYPSNHQAMWDKLKVKLLQMSKGSVKNSNAITMAENSGKIQAVEYIHELMMELENDNHL